MIPCFKGLVMGHPCAPDWAQASHRAVLERAGSFAASRRLRNRALFPRSEWVEGLVLDDHFGIGAVPASSTGAHQGLEESFAAAGRGYAQAGLQAYEAKAVRGERHATVVGAELSGREGLLGAGKLRRAVLALLCDRCDDLDGYTLLQDIQSAAGHLLILQARMQDSANYTCVASNSALERHSPPAEVTVYGKQKERRLLRN